MGNGKDSPPPPTVVRGVRSGDTAAFPAAPPRPSAGAAEALLEETGLVFDSPPAPEQAPGQQTPPFVKRILDEVLNLTNERIGEFWRRLWESLEERLGTITNEFRSALAAKADRSEVDSLSDTIGSLRGDIAASRETVEALKGTDDARREALDALNNKVHGFDGTMATFERRIGADEKAVREARGELEALRQADTGFSAEQTKLVARVRVIEQALEELKGALRGIREEALPDVRKAAVRAERAAAAASAQVAELFPRIEYVEGLASQMRGLQNFMERVGSLEGWRDRHSGDIADIAVRVGLNELAEELRGALPPEAGE